MAHCPQASHHSDGKFTGIVALLCIRPAKSRRGRLSVSYGPDYIRSAQSGAHVPPLSPAQLEAMAVLDQMNSDPRFSVTMDLRPGDMQFLNNHITLHSRTAYEEHPEPERRRDLIRLWLDASRQQ